MSYSPDERALVWLHACSGLEPKILSVLLEKTYSPDRLFRNFEKISLDVILKGQKSVYKEGSLSEREKELERFLADLERKECFAVTRASADYPEALAMINSSPLVLFGKGNRALLKKEKFVIVGSRKTPPWAEKIGSRVAEALSEHFVIVTGLAEGGDMAAIKGALKSGNLICVLPCGMDVCYPAAHASVKAEIARKGLLLTECQFGEKVRTGSFHMRNRILAGLGRGVLILSAGKKSGALITANYAVDYGREVFAFPYDVGAAQGVGCNELIKKGAFLCTGERDILDYFGIRTEAKPKLEISDEELSVMKALLEGEEMHAAAIAEQAEMQIYEVAAVLAALELKGLVVKVGGNRYKAIG